ncbi:hypothetical protein ES708_08672 [subsurface metagenome]
MKKGQKIYGLSRRKFLFQLAFFGSSVLISFSACKEIVRRRRKKSILTLSKKEKEILHHVQLHLLPENKGGPGANEINALQYIEWVLSDPNVLLIKRKLVINGIQWTKETADDMFGNPFASLDHTQKEKVLRDLETYSNGRRWIITIINYLLEALLGDPVYGCNTEEIGWKWLGHHPGFPRPAINKMYSVS